MFMFPPPPNAQQSRRSSPAKSRRTKSLVWIECIFFATLCAVVSLGLVYGPRTAEADLIKQEIGVAEFSQYPIPGSVYELTGGTTFCCPGGGDEPISLFSLSATSTAPGVPLPGPGEMVHGDGLFSDGRIIITDHDNVEIYGSFSYRISDEPPVSEDLSFGDLSFSDTLPSGTWQTELLSLELTGQLTGLSGPIPVIFRESPTLASLGQHVLTPLPDGSLHIDSFFDVFFELSLDGGPFVPADSPMRLDITAVVPEASQLLALGMLAMVPILAAWRRRHRRAAA